MRKLILAIGLAMVCLMPLPAWAADLTVICYGDTAHDGNYPFRDKFLGKVSITSLSTSSQSASLLPGTRYVKLVTDSSATVFFAFGQDSVTATTTGDELNAAQDEKIILRGIDGKKNNTIAARLGS